MNQLAVQEDEGSITCRDNFHVMPNAVVDGIGHRQPALIARITDAMNPDMTTFGKTDQIMIRFVLVSPGNIAVGPRVPPEVKLKAVVRPGIRTDRCSTRTGS